jgi:hypothetical protein
MWSSVLNSYRVLWSCHRHLNPKYRKLVDNEAASKEIHYLRSPAQIRLFLEAIAANKKGPATTGPSMSGKPGNQTE